MRHIRVDFIVQHDEEGDTPFLEALDDALNRTVLHRQEGERYVIVADSAASNRTASREED